MTSGLHNIPNGMIEGGGQDLRVVSGELQASDSLHVGLFKLTLALARGYFPNLKKIKF